MATFSDSHIQIASTKDIPAIRDLLNSAYRGESSKQGWTSETHLISGDVRTTDENLQAVIDLPESIFLKYIDPHAGTVGCVNLQKHGDRLYLGMFSVSPILQGAGIGKALLRASEEYARSKACKSIYMTVISLREDLINWYKRHGYVDTGKRQPFIEDAISGKHLQSLEFMTLEKIVA